MIPRSTSSSRLNEGRNIWHLALVRSLDDGPARVLICYDLTRDDTLRDPRHHKRMRLCPRARCARRRAAHAHHDRLRGGDAPIFLMYAADTTTTPDRGPMVPGPERCTLSGASPSMARWRMTGCPLLRRVRAHRQFHAPSSGRVPTRTPATASACSRRRVIERSRRVGSGLCLQHRAPVKAHRWAGNGRHRSSGSSPARREPDPRSAVASAYCVVSLRLRTTFLQAADTVTSRGEQAGGSYP